jgi:hypothetical protein
VGWLRARSCRLVSALFKLLSEVTVFIDCQGLNSASAGPLPQQICLCHRQSGGFATLQCGGWQREFQVVYPLESAHADVNQPTRHSPCAMCYAADVSGRGTPASTRFLPL